MTDSAAEIDQACGNCAHSKPGTGELGAAGWLSCTIEDARLEAAVGGRDWSYRSPHAACAFMPTRWQPKQGQP